MFGGVKFFILRGRGARIGVLATLLNGSFKSVSMSFNILYFDGLCRVKIDWINVRCINDRPRVLITILVVSQPVNVCPFVAVRYRGIG